MGKALAKLFGKKDMRILMLGLDAAGKTSILKICVLCVCVGGVNFEKCVISISHFHKSYGFCRMLDLLDCTIQF